MNNHIDSSILIADSRRGIYIPQSVAEDLAIYANLVSNMDEVRDDLAVLLEGPDNDEYWDAWDSVLYNLEFTHDGAAGRLHNTENGDIFIVFPSLMTLNEQSNMGLAEYYDQFDVGTDELVSIGSHFLPAIEYGDYSGLSGSDIISLELWLADNDCDIVNMLTEQQVDDNCEISGMFSHCTVCRLRYRD